MNSEWLENMDLESLEEIRDALVLLDYEKREDNTKSWPGTRSWKEKKKDNNVALDACELAEREANEKKKNMEQEEGGAKGEKGREQKSSTSKQVKFLNYQVRFINHSKIF